ncbi:MAG: tetratricopeptide repeat protein [Saprospiraceae bacterium]
MDQEIKKIYFKTIIQGRLEFGTAKSYGTVLKMYNIRAENYYKNDILFTAEEIFDEDKLTMEIPRFVKDISEKIYKNTMSLLDYCSQFAVTGSIRAWMSDSGRIMHYNLMEPTSDKIVVQSFLKGRKLVKVIGKEDEAIQALTKAIEKYDRHAQAYERRAKVCFFMKNYHDAIRDYTKCIGIDPTIPTSYYGRAKVHMINKDWQLAIDDFDLALKKSVALQPIYWKSRRLKSQCHIKLKQYELAAFDLKLFSLRKYGENDPNTKYVRWALFNYAIILEVQGKPLDALAQLEKAIVIPPYSAKDVQDREIIRVRGIAKKAGRKNGFLKDLKEASSLGDKKAITILKNL